MVKELAPNSKPSALKAILKTAVKLVLGRGSMRSYSQYGEDVYAASQFRNKRDGFYVDVGAYHPHLYSVTYALYKRGWRGIAIDPNPLTGMLFRIFRPRDVFVRAGVGKGSRTYRQFEDGAYNSFVEGTGEGAKEQKLRPLADILSEYRVTSIDFMNVDVEGMDLEVLQTHDWSILPKVIAVEAKIGSQVQQYLEGKGYVLSGFLGLTLFFSISNTHKQ